MVQLLVIYNGSTLRKFVTAHEGAFLALPDNKQTFFALVTLYAGRLRRRFWRQDVAILIYTEDSLAIRIAAAPEERAEPAVFI